MSAEAEHDVSGHSLRAGKTLPGRRQISSPGSLGQMHSGALHSKGVGPTTQSRQDYSTPDLQSCFLLQVSPGKSH